MKKIFFIFLCNLFFVICFFSITNAQEPAGSLATEVPIKEEVEAGDVICSTKEGFSKCTGEYQTNIYGVVVDSANLEISGTGLENARLVATTSVATVKVSSIAGVITKGSLVTSSEKSGVAELASKNGYVLGTALEDYSDTNIESVGKIQVLISIHPATTVSGGTSSNLLQFIREGLTVPVFEPLESFRYLLAAVLVIIAFSLGIVYFGRSSARGIEAIGRNPLAKRVIQLTILLNILLTLIIVIVGLAIAYFILVF